jgi:hypothetical protein
MRGIGPQGGGAPRRSRPQGAWTGQEPCPRSEVCMAHAPLAPARGAGGHAPTTHLASHDPWRDPESPPAPATSRRVLECDKPRGAAGAPGQHRETDGRGRWRQKPDTPPKAAPDLRTGPARTRTTSAQDVETHTRDTGRPPPRHPDHARAGNAGAWPTGPRTSMGSEVCTPQLWLQTRTLRPRRQRTPLRGHQHTTPLGAGRR